MKKTVKLLATVMSAVLMLSVCSCNKADSKNAVEPVIGLMEDSIGKSRADAEKLFEDYFGVELEGVEALKSGSDQRPIQSYFYDTDLTKDGVTFTSLVIMEDVFAETVYSVEMNSNNLDTAKKEYDTSSGKKSEIKDLGKAMNKAVQAKVGKPDYTEPLFEGSKESYSNRYKTDKMVYIVSVRDLTEAPDKGSNLVDTSITIFQT